MRKMTAALAALFVMSTPALAGDPAAGKEKSAVCGACHGADGNSPIPDFPRLAGQPEDYLLRALQDYKLGRQLASTACPRQMRHALRLDRSHWETSTPQPPPPQGHEPSRQA